VANEVCQAIEAYAVPYPKKTSSIQGIANMDASYCKFGDHPVFSKATALALLGDLDAAQRVFDQLIKPFPTVSSQHQDWAKRHGISF
jgi:hypothetical protein